MSGPFADRQHLSSARVKQIEGSVVRPAPLLGLYMPPPRSLAAETRSPAADSRKASPMRCGSVQLETLTGHSHVERPNGNMNDGSLTYSGSIAAPVVRQAVQSVPMQPTTSQAAAFVSRQAALQSLGSVQLHAPRQSLGFSSAPDRPENESGRSTVIKPQEHHLNPVTRSPKLCGDSCVSGLRQSLPTTALPTVESSKATVPSVAVQFSRTAERVPSIERDSARTQAWQKGDMPQYAVPPTRLIEELIKQQVDKMMESASTTPKRAEELHMGLEDMRKEVSLITMNTRNNTESILDLSRKYEDIWKVAEATSNRLPSEPDGTSKLVCVEQLEGERDERVYAASELTTLVHELRREVFASLSEVRTELNERIGERDSSVADKQHLESTVAKVMHPEREAWAKALARAVEIERTTRAKEIDQERAERETEIARLSTTLQELSLQTVPKPVLGGIGDALAREEVDQCLNSQRDQLNNMERRLSDFMSDILSRDGTPGGTMDASLADKLAKECQARADSHAELAVAIGRANIRCEERCSNIEHKLEELTNQAVAEVQARMQEHCESENRLSIATQQAAPAVTKVALTTGPDVQEKPLRIMIVGAAGLRDADLMPGSGMSDPYCTCELLGKPHASQVQTQVVKNTPNPLWNHEADLQDYTIGDTLVFKVYGQDSGKRDDYLGSLTVRSDMFDPHGFEGELPLQESGTGITATLRLRIPSRDERQQCIENGEAEVGVAALREEVQYLTEVVRREVESLHEGIDLLAGQFHHGGSQASIAQLQQLAAALDEEVGTRCANDELLQQELVELGGKVDELWGGIEAIGSEIQKSDPHQDPHPPTGLVCQ